ncbi:MAG TPA: gamma-glutamyltransferase [Solirubrobacteraceae bacterium]|nr:gamma-glutamyltransferase [Solirubrobacteraceae bacterium]
MPRRTQVALLASTLALAAPVGAQAEPYQHVTQPVAQGSGGAAATVDSVATEAATDALRAGGNAVDAAVAAAAVLGVTEPFSSGIGGGGFMVIRTPDGEVTTIDGREEAPAAMTSTAFIDPATGQPLTFANARYSGLSAGVPGTVATWDTALEQYGTWSLKRALQRGIDVAEQGFVIDRTFYEQANDNRAYFDDITSSDALYLDADDTVRDIGTVQRNPDMARAYERIAKLGAKGFYRGAIADAMVAAAQQPPLDADADPAHPWRSGLLTMRDIKGYEAIEREPTRTRYRGFDVYGMAPPSSGGSTVGEALNIIEGVPGFDALTRTQQYHWFLEASRFAFADRNRYVGDPAYVDVPLAGLLSQSFADERRALISPTQAAASPVAPGDPTDDGGATLARMKARSATAVNADDQPLRSTTHLTVADDEGTVVSYTFTIESTGGNGIVVPGWGFLLNNELTDFSFTSTQGAAPDPNLPAGGKRPRSSMAPTIVQRDGEPVLATGSPGGATIITTVLQVLLERLDFGKSLPAAIAAPRASQRNSATTQAEPAFIASPEGQELDTVFGHDFVTPALTPPTNGEIGAVTGIDWLADGELQAAAEPVRRGGGAAGVVDPG